jgi:hypothetical protein
MTEQLIYAKMPVEQLLALCYKRIPGFAINIFCFPGPYAQVMTQFRYDITSPLWAWQRTRSEEASMGGTYPSIREGLVAILNRVDRFDVFQAEWKLAQETEAKRRAQAAEIARAASAAADARAAVDEGDEEVTAVEWPTLEPVTPLPDEPSAEPRDG